MVILSPQKNVEICPSYVDSQVRKNSSKRSAHGIVKWMENKAPKLVCSIHFRYLDPI
jgi:hypothetical protein